MTITSMLSAAAALAVILGVIVLGGRIARSSKFTSRTGRGSGRIAIVEQLSLDPRRRLVLVQCDGSFVLLLTGQQDQVVGWLPKHAA